MVVIFFVIGRPAAQGSKRHLGKGIMVESSKLVKPWRQDVKAEAQKHCRRPFTGAVRISLMFTYPRPKTHFLKSGEPGSQWVPYRTVSPDLDKMVRSTLDALTGVAFVDDRQVIEITAKKLWVAPEEHQGCSISIEEKV